jgi:hypothetical protein
LEQLTKPNYALQGQGLACCLKAKVMRQADQSKSAAAARYDAKIAGIGKVIALEPYKDSGTKILHKCLTHNEEHLGVPSSLLAGRGLKCCRQAAIQAQADRRKAMAAAKYDARLAALGRVIRLGKYQGCGVPIMHRCMEHGEDHLARPDDTLAGHGLRCCRLAQSVRVGVSRNCAAAAKYEDAIAAIGKVVSLEPYKTSKTKILHRCIEHNEEHLGLPCSLLQGHGLRCCYAAAPRLSTLANAILRPHDDALSLPCAFYVYGLQDRPELAKPGISKSHSARSAESASRGLYGDLEAAWDLPTRRDALLIEGAILRDPSIPAPADLGGLEGINGCSEVRRIAPAALASRAQDLIDSLADHVGPWQQWALDNVPTLHRGERIALRRQMA